MAASYEIKRAKNKQFYFNLKATNGEIILTSETYKSRAGAANGIESVQRHGPDCLRYDMKIKTLESIGKRQPVVTGAVVQTTRMGVDYPTVEHAFHILLVLPRGRVREPVCCFRSGFGYAQLSLQQHIYRNGTFTTGGTKQKPSRILDH